MRKITVYGTKDCIKCKELINYLTENKKEFVYIDAETQDLEKLMDKYGTSVPILEIIGTGDDALKLVGLR